MTILVVLHRRLEAASLVTWSRAFSACKWRFIRGAVNYLHKYKCIHTMKLPDLQTLVEEDLKVNMTLTQLIRAKLLTIARLEGDLKTEYGLL